MKKSGDPNLAFWIINEAVQVQKLTPKNLVQQAWLVQGGLTQLKGYARRRENIEILDEIKNKELAQLPRSEKGVLQEEPGYSIAVTLMKQALN